MRKRMARAVAIGGAVICWAGLAVQLALIVDDMGDALAAFWRFLAFFTIIANICVAAVLTHAALLPARRGGLGAPGIEFAVAVAIALVGVVYSVVLRGLYELAGWQLVVDHVQHDAMPLIYLLFWLLRPHGDLGRRAMRGALILPVGYYFYALARGAVEGWYPYPFMDASRLGIVELIVNVLILCVALGLIGLILLAIDRALSRQDQP